MASDDDALKASQIVDARFRNISGKVRCTDCGSQSIEDSEAEVAVLLRKLIRDEIRAGKSDKDIFKKLEDEFGETVLYAPKFDMQTAALWLSPILIAGVAVGGWAYKKHRQRNDCDLLVRKLLRRVMLTRSERQVMVEVLTPPPSTSSWWTRLRGR